MKVSVTLSIEYFFQLEILFQIGMLFYVEYGYGLSGDCTEALLKTVEAVFLMLAFFRLFVIGADSVFRAVRNENTCIEAFCIF